MLTIEQELWTRGYRLIAGIDEVGRGPLAGPVYACAAVFERDYSIDGVRDSKLLTPEIREELAVRIRETALAIGIGQAGVEEIDRINIRQASFLAMRRAVAALKSAPEYLIIDGEDVPGMPCPGKGIIRGDEQSFTIAAASIVAKVERDAFMCRLHEQYPFYAFASNKGYGTAEHIICLKRYGPSPCHRRTFLRKIL